MVGDHRQIERHASNRARRAGRPGGRRHAWFAGLLGGLIALAVWGKLRFVSDVPRMAYADPEQREPSAPQIRVD